MNLTLKRPIIYWNFHPRDPHDQQFQVGENYSDLTKFRLTILLIDVLSGVYL